MASSFFALFDDIASILDDIATLSKVASRQAAGVVGDDLAVGAQQVSGSRADRELPVVLAVALGSLRNKAILVPVALLLSQFLPWLVHPLLLVGGVYLCLEGMEKLVHRPGSHAAEGSPAAPADPAALEKEKIRGAVKTDFVLSAEILAIALGNVAGSSLAVRSGVLLVVALGMTAGVYGLVAFIVKIDDAGLWLSRKPGRFVAAAGRSILAGAPWLMKFLSVAGTAAMFLVGGGIVVHSLPLPHLEGPLLPHLADAVAGLLAGALALAGVRLAALVRRRRPGGQAS